MPNMRTFPKRWKVQGPFGVGESKPKGGTVRKLLLMAALCMAATLAFAPMAMAQDDLNCDDLSEAEEQAVFASDPSDPNNLDDDDDSLPCEDDTTDNGSFELPTGGNTTMMMEETTMMAEPTMMEETTMVTSSAGQYGATATPEPLPETGGPSGAAFALPSLVLLVASGIFAARMVRR